MKDRGDQSGETFAQLWLVSGRVQGVGFRYYVCRKAAAFEVNGEVRNLEDGRVEAHVSGPRERLRRLLDEVRRGPRGSLVEKVEVSDLKGPTEFEGFEIRY